MNAGFTTTPPVPPYVVARLQTDSKLDLSRKDAEQAAAAMESALLDAVKATSNHGWTADRIAHVHLLALHAEAAALHNKIKLLSIQP